MAQLRELHDSIRNKDNILHADTRDNYDAIIYGVGRRAKADGGSGNFCFAFKMADKATGRKFRCFRVWKTPQSAADIERYRLIAQYLRKWKMRFMIDYDFAPRALRVEDTGEELPGTYMEWVEGQGFSDYLTGEWRHQSADKRMEFIHQCVLMFHHMNEISVAHGDLSCKNIIVRKNSSDIVLVDYDSVYVPDMGNRYLQTTGGVPQFQHPLRLRAFDSHKAKASAADDNFASLVIVLSLFVAHYDLSALDFYSESNLLFEASDFDGATGAERLASLKKSRGWKLAEKVARTQQHILPIMDALTAAVQGPVENIPSICDVITYSIAMSDNFPFRGTKEVTYVVRYCTACGRDFNDDGSTKYCHACGARRHSYKKTVNI